eukprot:EG_transcript_17022
MVRLAEHHISISAPDESGMRTPSPSLPLTAVDAQASSPAYSPSFQLANLPNTDSPSQAVWQLEVGGAFVTLPAEASERVEAAHRQGLALAGFTREGQVWLVEFVKGVARDSAGAEVPVRRVVKADTGPPSHRSGPPSLDSSPTMALLNPSPSQVRLFSKRFSTCSSHTATSSSASPEASPMYSPLHSPTRAPRRLPLPGAGAVAEWFFSTDQQPWTPYDAALAAKLEAAYLAKSPPFYLMVPGHGIHPIDLGTLQQCDASPPTIKLLRVLSGPGERCLKCQRRLKWRLKSMEVPETEEYICGDCDQPCDKSLDGFVHCPRCHWYICRSCELEGEEFAQRKRQERLQRHAERQRRRAQRAQRQPAADG